MEWMTRLNEAVTYIEQHMKDEIKLEEAARIACTSSYNFQRMFSYMTGISISEYIRKRRMSLAAEDLQLKTDKIIDIALRYQYASPTAFNRAFRSVHGIAPSLVRSEHPALKLYPPLHFQLDIAGRQELNYRIVKKKAFRIVGAVHEMEKELEKNYETVPAFWQSAGANGTIAELAAHIQKEEPCGLLGISMCRDDEDWKFYIGVVSDAPLPGYEELLLPEAAWIVFSCEGTHASIQEMERRIWTEWFPSTGYQYMDGPVMEVYLDPDPCNSRLEMWLMIQDSEHS